MVALELLFLLLFLVAHGRMVLESRPPLTGVKIHHIGKRGFWGRKSPHLPHPSKTVKVQIVL